MRRKTYRRLTETEREEISRGIAQRKPIQQIATELKRSPSTVFREIKRNSGKTGYRAFTANRKARKAASSRKTGKSKLGRNQRLQKYVIEKLEDEWSPQEISGRIKMDYPLDMEMRISHEAIYQYLYVLPRGELKRLLISALRQEHKYRRPQKKGKKTETRGKIANMLSIEERPAEVADRSVPGHWEGDLILGKYKRSALGTLVERTTRYTLLVPLGANKNAQTVRKEFTKAFQSIPVALKKTMTYDQGKEMSEHEQFTIDSNIQVYFAHPGSPWERGSNENTNGLIRQYFPKGTDFSEVSEERINEVQRKLNGRPRKALNYYKPDEVITKLLDLLH